MVCTEECDKIQEDLNKLIDWSEKWLMSLNAKKCKVRHIGDKNSIFKFQMRDQELDKVKLEKDLGVIINCNLKVNDQCIAASKKANMILGLILRNFDYKAPEVMKKLYTAFLRPHLEYAIQFWSPNYIENQNLLERVQRRATKFIPTLCNLSYEERCK